MSYFLLICFAILTGFCYMEHKVVSNIKNTVDNINKEEKEQK